MKQQTPILDAALIKDLVIVGNGMATGRLLDEITNRLGDAPAKHWRITVIGDEPHGSYNRIMLSSVLAGETTFEAIVDKPVDWYQENNIKLLTGCRVTNINKDQNTIDLAYRAENTNQNQPSQISFDHLVIATGSRSAKIPAKNQELSNIVSFRTIEDASKIQQMASVVKQAVVVGGGLLGLEAAYGLAVAGVKVTVIHRNKWLLNRQLDNPSAQMLTQILASKGVEFALSEEVETFVSDSDNAVSAAKLKSGKTLDCQLAVIATGITPNSELADGTLDKNRAILVDQFMTTSQDNISALGECCEFEGACFGLVEPIWSQCKTLADKLVLNQRNQFKNAPVPTKLKVSGVQLYSAGLVEAPEEARVITIKDQSQLVYRKLIFVDQCLVGAILFGDVSSGMEYFDLIQKQLVLSEQAITSLVYGMEFVDQKTLAVDAEDFTRFAA